MYHTGMLPLVVVADLSHTYSGIAAPTFPLGAGYVAAYLAKNLGHAAEVVIHKFPDETYKDLSNERCKALLLSNYSWNEQLATAIATIAKEISPKIVTVMGGPNFPTESDEKRLWLEDHGSIDFYIELEGEIPAYEIVKRIIRGHDLTRLQSELIEVPNLVYLKDGTLVETPARRLSQIGELESPYLNGMFDKFFEDPIIPMVETTRGCPFSCTFCADGLAIKNKITRHESKIVERELDYIAIHNPKSPELIITDLNYGMYPEDEATSEKIALIQKQYNWPVTISASAGKNKSERIMKNMEVLDGTWSAGASIQSTDPKVLLNIKRKNISSSAYLDIVNLGTKLSSDSKTHSEIILGLPGDTKVTHFESLRFVVDSGIDTIRMFQAILLPGTEMATVESRKDFKFRTAWRVIPGASGIYRFGPKEVAIAETEEIIVGSDLISHSDYLDCRVMNLVVESFYNNGIFKEVFSILSFFELSRFDYLYQLYQALNTFGNSIAHDEVSELQRIVFDFRIATSNSIFESRQSLLHEFEKSLAISEQDIDIGRNEILHFRAIMVTQMISMVNLVITTLESFLREREMHEKVYRDFYLDLTKHLIASRSVFEESKISSTEERVQFAVDLPRILDEIAIRKTTVLGPQKDFDEKFVYVYQIPKENCQYIKRQENIYMKSALGMGRMLQRSNLNLFFRKPMKESTNSSVSRVL
jgi:radical SAM superfamily enzyme YgiQ (UPF0313 family)